MAFTVKDLKLPADKAAQIERALGGDPNTNEALPALQGICDEAAVDVARLTTGYVIDDVSISNFIRAIALQRAYAYIGPSPKAISDNYDAAWKELTEISQGKRPNLAHADSPGAALPGVGAWGSKTIVPGRFP